MSRIYRVVLWIVASLFLALLVGLVIRSDSILVSMGNFLIVDEVPQKADVIIVLGGDFGDRIAYGAKLYQLGYADKVLLSGGGREMTRQALSLGIPANAILVEDQSTTTFENAKYSLNIVNSRGYKSAIVVTSPFHTRRTSIIFNQRFKSINLTICAVPYDLTLTHNWWKSSNLTEFVISEYLKLIWHYIFEWH